MLKLPDLPDFGENFLTGEQIDYRPRNEFINKCIALGWKYHKKGYLYQNNSNLRIEVWDSKEAELIYYSKFSRACKSRHIRNCEYKLLNSSFYTYEKFLNDDLDNKWQ